MFCIKMGKVGAFVGKGLGGFAGHHAGLRLKKYTGVDEKRGKIIGQKVGRILGEALIPFKKGGRVKFKGAILAHKGEFVLPKGVEPTTHQIKLVKKGRTKKACK
jgi:hypothetical protein